MPTERKDYLFPQLRELPYFRAFLRAVEASFYQDLPLPQPTLDLGCGDGHFAARTFERPLDVGLDPWWAPLREARHKHGQAYRLLVQADGAAMPFPDATFASAVSNSVLEHIPHLDAVLAETARVLQPGAPFYFCVPNHNFLPNLSIGRALDKIGLRPLGDAYRAFFNRISRHHHCDAPATWEARLDRTGFEVVTWWHYFPPKALHILEWGHYFGLPSLIAKKLTGRWILAPTRWNLGWLERRLRPLYENPKHPEGAYTFYIARRRG
ncbi:MAG: class I SAM-dependent methyltransferase [Chloroflexi bacterium]|nr:class I SAM-dependent methyltransferase [Chloroflexota bacterium]